MIELRKGTVGILPAGALGVGFFHHLTGKLTRMDGRVFFVERAGSKSGAAMRRGGTLRIAQGSDVRVVDPAGLFRPSMAVCADEGWLPEVLLVCTQPDQLLGVLGEWVSVFECLRDPDALPVLVLASNGIYFQRARQFFIELLEEKTLLGRLPDLWPEMMPRLVGRVMRGVTIQTGQREGSGAAAVYRPGPRGLTRLAGGDPALRAGVAALLNELGAWCELAADATPTRVEFDKAMINLVANLLGQLAAIDETGRFRRITAVEMLEAEHADEVRTLIRHVLAVGHSVRAYRPEETLDGVLGPMLEAVARHADHVPSSIQWIEDRLRSRTLVPRLTPTEVWLLEPLIRYAHAAGLEEAARYFEDLTRRVEHRLALAVSAR
jgi:hypothetical protein